jgi:hypothetical protein
MLGFFVGFLMLVWVLWMPTVYKQSWASSLRDFLQLALGTALKNVERY